MRPIVDVVMTNIAAMRRANTRIRVLPNCGNWYAARASTSPFENSTLAASTEVDAAPANSSAMYKMPATSWMFDSRMLTRSAVPATHIRSATTNQMKAIPANGMRYRPTIITRRCPLLR